MPLFNTVIPGLKEGFKILPSEILGGMGFSPWANFFYVDADNGSDSNVGNSPTTAFATIQAGVTASAAGGVVAIKSRKTTALSTDPNNYAETIIIPNATSELTLFGYGTGRVQNGIPQIKKGSGSTALLTVRAPGCGIFNLGFNGGSSTGGGILLDDDGGTSKVACGTTISTCHFKNCVGSTATDASTGGAIQWSANGGAWQTLIDNNRFYKNVGDVVLKGTSVSVPQDVVISNNEFSGPAASVDCQLFLKGGGSGINGLHIVNNRFPAMPAIGSGANARYGDLTGCVGIMSGCTFASIVSPTGSEGTFAAAGTLMKIPQTVYITSCYGETTTTGETGEIFRT